MIRHDVNGGALHRYPTEPCSRLACLAFRHRRMRTNSRKQSGEEILRGPLHGLVVSFTDILSCTRLAPTDEIYHRPVRIFRPSQPSTSSAKATSHHWRIDWDILPGANRWENPLMGWASRCVCHKLRCRRSGEGGRHSCRQP